MTGIRARRCSAKRWNQRCHAKRLCRDVTRSRIFHQGENLSSDRSRLVVDADRVDKDLTVMRRWSWISAALVWAVVTCASMPRCAAACTVPREWRHSSLRHTHPPHDTSASKHSGSAASPTMFRSTARTLRGVHVPTLPAQAMHLRCSVFGRFSEVAVHTHARLKRQRHQRLRDRPS